MQAKVIALLLGVLATMFMASYAAPSKVYALWYCGTDQCSWSSEPDLANATWITNRGDGKPTANVVILSFVDPVALLQKTTNADLLGGVPRGMTQKVVDFFKSKGITVMLSIGGAEYTSKWEQALSQDPSTLARNAANAANQLGVGIEIDYENENAQSLKALDTFVHTYRSAIPNGNSPQSILTIDLGAGTGYLTAVSKAASGWLNSSLINWAYAMVAGSPYSNVQEGAQYWQQHLDGVNWDSIPPMAPNTLVVSIWASNGSRNCKNYAGTTLEGTVGWVGQKHTRGISFWAAGCPAPNNCVSDCTGIQTGSKNFLG